MILSDILHAFQWDFSYIWAPVGKVLAKDLVICHYINLYNSMVSNVTMRRAVSLRQLHIPRSTLIWIWTECSTQQPITAVLLTAMTSQVTDVINLGPVLLRPNSITLSSGRPRRGPTQTELVEISRTCLRPAFNPKMSQAGCRLARTCRKPGRKPGLWPGQRPSSIMGFGL